MNFHIIQAIQKLKARKSTCQASNYFYLGMPFSFSSLILEIVFLMDDPKQYNSIQYNELDKARTRARLLLSNKNVAKNKTLNITSDELYVYNHIWL